MATLANLVKNIDPPIELTQAQYDALSTDQKQDGTVYYVTDGVGAFQTAATTPAEDSSDGTSNVQAELDKRVEISHIVNNTTTTQAGYVLDARMGEALFKTLAGIYTIHRVAVNNPIATQAFAEEIYALATHTADKWSIFKATYNGQDYGVIIQYTNENYGMVWACQYGNIYNWMLNNGTWYGSLMTPDEFIQRPGLQTVINIGGVIYPISTTEAYVWKDLPVVTKNASYTISVSALGSIVNLGAPSAITAYTKTNTGIMFKVSNPSGKTFTTGTPYFLNNAIATITWA